MSELPNFPIVNQLADNDVNKSFDCVPASIAAGLEFLTGKHFTAGQIKDAVYGASYQGGTAAYAYISFCGGQGVRLFPINGSNIYLITQAHSELSQGHPVVFTEPDPYMAASSGESHVCVWFKDNGATLTAMDPFGGKFLEKSDSEWASLLLFNQIWSMEKATTMAVPNGWKDDGATLTAPNAVPVIQGFRQYVLANNWHPDNIPLQKEHGSNQIEAGNPGLGGGTLQEFRLCVLEWTQTTGVQEMWVGQEILAIKNIMTDLYKQLAQLTNQLKIAQTKSTPDVSQITAMAKG